MRKGKRGYDQGHLKNSKVCERAMATKPRVSFRNPQERKKCLPYKRKMPRPFQVFSPPPPSFPEPTSPTHDSSLPANLGESYEMTLVFQARDGILQNPNDT